MAALSVPPPAARVLAIYQGLLEERAPGLVAALYLHGSVALGAYTEGKSDLDFVAVLSSPAEKADLAALARIHRDVARVCSRPELQGAYLQLGDLGRSGRHSPHPAYSDGKLRASTRAALSPVDRWILGQRGIAVFGPELSLCDLGVSWDEVADHMALNLQTYWAPWLTSPRRLAYLLTDEGVEWAVLGICRLVHGLAEGQLVSKLEAGERALSRLPARWHPLLREAIGLRSGKSRGYYRSRIPRALEARAFLRYVVEKQWR